MAPVTLVIIALVIIALYTGVMIYKAREIPESISATVFYLSPMNKWVFTIVMWVVAFCLMPVLLDVSKDSTRFLAFFAMAGILGVGASPLVLKERNGFHYVCAVLSGVSSQLLVALNKPTCLFVYLLYAAYIVFAKDETRNFFFLEVSCMLTVFAYCLTF